MLSSADSARLVPLDQLPDLLKELLPHMPIARASWVVTQLTHRVELGQSHRIRPYELRNGDQFLLGAVVLEQPVASAMLLVINGPLMQQPNFEQRSRSLIELIKCQLAEAKTRFLQICVDEEVEAQRLGQLGFEPIADLALMVHEISYAVDSAESQIGHMITDPPKDSLAEFITTKPAFLQVEHDPQLIVRLCRIAEESFQETSDCPRLARFRSPQDITAGFCLADLATPELWRLVQVEGEDAGCIFLTPHRNREADNGIKDGIVALELTYMALLPRFRRRGIAQSVLMETVQMARTVGAQRIVLAVDNENLPAKKLYQRSGWVEVAIEKVLGSHVLA